MTLFKYKNCTNIALFFTVEITKQVIEINNSIYFRKLTLCSIKNLYLLAWQKYFPQAHQK